MTRKRLWMNRISGIVCLLLWIAFSYFSFWNNREDCRDGTRNYVAGGCYL